MLLRFLGLEFISISRIEIMFGLSNGYYSCECCVAASANYLSSSSRSHDISIVFDPYTIFLGIESIYVVL